MNIILDVDGTLIDNYLLYNKYEIVPRPYLKQFLHFCFENFQNVSIWTHADNNWFEYVYLKILKDLLPLGKSFHFIKTSNFHYENNTGYYTTERSKKLEHIYIDYEEYDELNTFILDDTPSTYRFNIENSIPIKPFDFDINDDSLNKDKELLKVIKYLKKNLFR